MWLTISSEDGGFWAIVRSAFWLYCSICVPVPGKRLIVARLGKEEEVPSLTATVNNLEAGTRLGLGLCGFQVKGTFTAE